MMRTGISCFLLFLTASLYGVNDFTSSNLPIIIINTQGKEILDDPRITAFMGIINNPGKENNFTTDKYNEYSGSISIEIRGATSQSFPKKQYSIETQNEDGSNRNVEILGFPKENDWILHGPYSDKTLMRNYLSSYISNALGDYAPRMDYCELILNNEYKGVYLWCEKIKQDKNRVDISKISNSPTEPNDFSGGYLLEIDRPNSDNYYWKTSHTNTSIICDYPEKEKLSSTHKLYLKNLFDEFENRLFSDSFSDSIEGYRPIIDINSFVNFFIVNELSKNIDAYKLSTFIYKDRDDIDHRLKMGPIWDFNLAYGNVDYNEGYLDSGFVAATMPWWKRLMQDSIFNNAVSDKWTDLRNNVLLKENLYNVIDSVVFEINDAQNRNFSTWDILGKDIWPNYYIGNNYEQEISYLKDWLERRITWLDNNIPGNKKNLLPLEKNDFKLYPNPIINVLKLDLNLVEPADISIVVYNAQGKELCKLINNDFFDEGKYHYEFDSHNFAYKTGRSLYFVTIVMNGKIEEVYKLYHI